MSNAELAMMTAEDLVGRYRTGEVSPVEATRAALDRIDAFDKTLNAFVFVTAEEALASARESEARWRQGAPLGPIDGVPATIKDMVWMKGYPTRRGSLATPDTPEAEDAPITARLREAGAVFLGKTTTPEFGWKGVTDCPLTGITRNPWDPARTPGGSSGGAAASVAVGMGTLAVGTDGGGSIRIPSALTGVFGHKPTTGAVPVYPPAGVGTCAAAGPMTRTVRDGALMMNVVAQHDGRDWQSMPRRREDCLARIEEGVKGLRIAFCPGLGYAQTDKDVEARAREAAAVFERLGARVEELDAVVESPRGFYENFYRVAMASSYRVMTGEQHENVDPGFREMAEQGLQVDLFDLQSVEKDRAMLGAAVNRVFERFDLLFTSPLAVTAFEAGHEYPPGRGMRRWLDWCTTAYPFNMTGHPAASVPCGFGDNGMPVGLQIVAPRFEDALVFRAARAYEREHPFALPKTDKLKKAA
jgi:aspartyl-tRNA(Asn)/glutamyl-tRNA(Gln) amidotransferase subunit A